MPRAAPFALSPGHRLLAVLAMGLALWLVVLPFAVDGAIGLLRRFDSASGPCRVARVVDGDTVNLWCARRGPVKARLLGYDSPEMFSPRCLSEFARAQHATWYLRWALLTAGQGRLTLRDPDRYGRTLASLSLDGRDIALIMVGQGLGRPYRGGQRQGWCG